MENENLINFKFDYNLVNSIVLKLDQATSMKVLKLALGEDGAWKVESLMLMSKVDAYLVNHLFSFTPNIIHIAIMKFPSNEEWLTNNLLTQWKLQRFEIHATESSTLSVIYKLHDCSHLRFLYIHSKYFSLPQNARYTVNCIKKYIPKLECLRVKISRWLDINHEHLLALLEHGLPLNYLDIPQIPIFPSVEIADRCKLALSCIPTLCTANLPNRGVPAKLYLPYCTGLTSITFNNMNDQYYINSIIVHCHKLESINIIRMYPSSRIVATALQALSLNWLPCSMMQFTDTALIELIHASPHLHTLYLPYETAITNIGILALSEHCPQLQHLDIGYCTLITDTSILALSKRCRRLTYLNIGTCTDITDNTIVKLFENCYYLNRLYIQSSKYLTEAVIIDILQWCTQLKVLKFSDRNCKIGTVNFLQKQYSGVVVIQHYTSYNELLCFITICIIFVGLIYTSGSSL